MSANLTPTEERALAVLRAHPEGMAASDLGIELFLEPGRRISPASQSSNRYARTTGALMARLEAKGKVRGSSDGHRWRWKAVE